MKQKLWTIQHRDAYEQLIRDGILRANEPFMFGADEFRFAYDWMAKQMYEKIGDAPEGVCYPVWAWYQWEGKQKRRDLRYSGYAMRGTPMVQMELLVEENLFLLSDFDDWNLVLGKDYLSDSEEDYESFYLVPGENRQSKIEASWQKIFDLNRFSPNWSTPMEEKTIQATLWEISISQVQKVEFFTAK